MALDILRNCICIADGVKIASSTTLRLPKIKMKTEKEYFGGSDGESESEYGLQAMDAMVKVGAIEPGLSKQTALKPGAYKSYRFNGAAVGERSSSVISVRVRILGKIADLDAGDWKHGARSEWDHRLIVKAYKLMIGNEVIHDIDPENFIRIVDGVDQLAEIRDALEIG